MGQFETAKTIWDYLVSQGWSKTAVAGLLGTCNQKVALLPTDGRATLSEICLWIRTSAMDTSI